MQTPYDREVVFEQTGRWHLVAAAIGMTALSAWIYVMTGEVRGLVIGSVGLIVFGTFSLAGLFLAMRPGPAVILDQRGFVDRTSLLGGGFVPWSDVQAVTASSEFVEVQLWNPTEFRRRQKSWKRWLLSLNRIMGWHGDAYIVSRVLPIPASELAELMQARLSRAAAGGREFRGLVWVDCGRLELLAGEFFDQLGETSAPGDSAECRPGRLAATAFGHAVVATGLHTGMVGVRVLVADRDPGAELDDYEDVVEVDFQTAGTTFQLIEPDAGAIRELPPLPPSDGNYRLRYHARGMDAAREADTNPDDAGAIDQYLLQVWPSEPRGALTVKVTSRLASWSESQPGA